MYKYQLKTVHRHCNNRKSQSRPVRQLIWFACRNASAPRPRTCWQGAVVLLCLEVVRRRCRWPLYLWLRLFVEKLSIRLTGDSLLPDRINWRIEFAGLLGILTEAQCDEWVINKLIICNCHIQNDVRDGCNRIWYRECTSRQILIWFGNSEVIQIRETPGSTNYNSCHGKFARRSKMECK